MVSEPNLKSLYEGLEPDDREMALYRNRLKEKLHRRPSFTLRGWALACVGVVTLALLVNFFAKTPPGFSQDTMDDLVKLVSTSDAQHLTNKAKQVMHGGNELERHNAMAVLCMLLPSNEGIAIAGRALQQDPRKEFRVFYLEYLLEEADENIINAKRVEELMDREDDAVCLSLLRDLLAIS